MSLTRRVRGQQRPRRRRRHHAPQRRVLPRLPRVASGGAKAARRRKRHRPRGDRSDHRDAILGGLHGPRELTELAADRRGSELRLERFLPDRHTRPHGHAVALENRAFIKAQRHSRQPNAQRSRQQLARSFTVNRNSVPSCPSEADRRSAEPDGAARTDSCTCTAGVHGAREHSRADSTPSATHLAVPLRGSDLVTPGRGAGRCGGVGRRPRQVGRLIPLRCRARGCCGTRRRPAARRAPAGRGSRRARASSSRGRSAGPGRRRPAGSRTR